MSYCDDTFCHQPVHRSVWWAEAVGEWSFHVMSCFMICACGAAISFCTDIRLTLFEVSCHVVGTVINL